VRSGLGAPRPELADTILHALPIVPDIGAGAGLEPLGGAATDGLTLLGNHRALQHALLAAVGAGRADQPFALVLAQLEDLAEVNAEHGLEAGDRMIQVAARAMQRSAARLGGTAYRPSGRRLAVLAPLRDREVEALRADVQAELAAGPRVRTAAVAWRHGESGDELLERARRALVDPGA
jgi:GGDEF domain-containing protein